MPIDIAICKRCIWEHRNSKKVTHIRASGFVREDWAMGVFVCCPFASNVLRTEEPPKSCPYLLEHVVTEPRESTINDYLDKDGFLEEMVAESERIPVDFEQEI